MSAIIWVHMDALSRNHPVFDAAPDGADILYIWDAKDIERRGWSLKRCIFVLECLEEMEVTVVEGDYADTLSSLEAETIFSATTPDPVLKSVIAKVGATAVDELAFTSIPANADMGRFFRYWNKAKGQAMKPTRTGEAQ